MAEGLAITIGMAEGLAITIATGLVFRVVIIMTRSLDLA
jgi:hypothetical protein